MSCPECDVSHAPEDCGKLRYRIVWAIHRSERGTRETKNLAIFDRQTGLCHLPWEGRSLLWDGAIPTPLENLLERLNDTGTPLPESMRWGEARTEELKGSVMP